MRYSILGFNQEELIKYGVDMSDVLLMDYIQKALSQPSMCKIFRDEQPYVWLQHSKILEDLPILNIKESMLKKRIANLIEAGLIASTNIANTNGRGSRAYYTITDAFEALQMTEYKKLAVVEQASVKNYTSNNQLSKDNNTLSKDNVSRTRKLIDTVEQKKSGKSQYVKCMELIDDFTDDEVLRDYLKNCYKLFNENAREAGTPFYTNTFKGKINKLKKLSDDNYEQREIVLQTLDNGWNSFYALKQDKRVKNAMQDIEKLGNYKVRQGNKQALKESIKNGTAEKF